MLGGRTVTDEVECPGVTATDAEWRELRATAVDVAVRASFAGYASDRFGSWEISAQRRAMGVWPPGTATLLLTLAHRHCLVRQWLADVPAAELLS